MRIGVLCHSGIGGSVRIATALASELAHCGHSVHVMARTPPVADWLNGNGVLVHSLLPAEDRGCTVDLKLDWGGNEEADFCAMVADVIRAESLEVLHAHYAVPFVHVAARLVHELGDSAPVTIATLHGTDVSVHGREPDERRRLTESLRRLAAITTVSDDHARLAGRLFALAEPPVVIPNFVNLQRFRPAVSPHHDRPRIAHVSNFRRVKDPRSLTQIFLAIRERIDAELWLIGDGPTLPALMASLSEAGAESSVRSFGATMDVGAIMRQADVLLMTSVAESFCLAAAEAMACGLPVVATRVGGIGEVVEDGETGHLFAVGDHASAAAAIVELLERPLLRRRLGTAARRRAARFTPERIVPLYAELYRTLVGSQRRATLGARAQSV